MITSMAFAISTTTVSATHDQTPTIDESTVKGSTSMILTITINNAGPAAIENVRITMPSGFSNFAPTIKVFEDNIVMLEGGNNNIVTLPAGTLIEVPATANVSVVENTSVIIASGTWIYWTPTVYYTAKLTENLSAKITNKTLDTDAGTPGTVDNLTFDIGLDNANTVADIVATVSDGTARLLADTQVVRVSDNVVRLPEDLLVELVNPTTVTIGLDNKLALEKNETVGLGTADTVNPPSDNTGRIFTATAAATTSTVYTVQSGENVLIMVENSVVFPAGTQVILENGPTVTLFENTEVIRVANDNVVMTSETATAAENQPKNWMQYDDTPDAQSIEWKGIGENQITSGGNLAFPFAVTTPSGTPYTIIVRTKDTAGNVTIKEVALTVDGTNPTVELAVSPEWAKASTAVTITVTADESLAKLDNVMVAEKDAPENTQISMTPDADNKVWTGTYTTSDNVDRDGLAMVYVIGAQLEDLVGNTGATNPTDNFNVDKVKPPTPSVMDSIYGWVDAKKYTNIGEWLVEGYAQDNYLTVVDNTEGMTVKVRVGTTTHDVTSGAGGYYHNSVTLTQGVQEVGIQYVDEAGNAGTENVENITYDATKPSISITAPASGAIINDSTPTITVTIADAVMGVENKAHYDENYGYKVELRRDNDNTVLATLTPITDPTSDPIKSFTFENQWPTDNELPQMKYNIFVQAGDNLQQDNTYSTFEVDVTAPTVPTPGTGENPLSGTTVISPLIQKSTTLTLVGNGAEAGATVKVYLDGATTAAKTTTVDSTGGWTVDISLTAGATIKVEITLTDVATNEGARYLYGYVMADGNAPTVTLTTLPETTDKSSITISGTITKDGWEDWSDITLTVQVGTGRVVVPIGAGGSYSYSLALSEGPNTIVVQASDVIGNASVAATSTVERVVTPWSIYAIILVIVALILAAIAIFGGPRIWKR